MIDIVIFGSGGFAREVAMLIEQINEYEEVYNLLGFIDDDEKKWLTDINGYPVLGNERWIDDYNFRNNKIIAGALGVGSPKIKRKIVNERKDFIKWPNLIHPSVYWHDTTNSIGKGNIITAGNVLTTNIAIGNFTTLNLSCTVGHESKIDDYVVISPGVNVSGNVYIKEGAYIGTGAKILEKHTIGHWSTVGGAALVNKDVPNNATVVGVPVKIIKEKESGWHAL